MDKDHRRYAEKVAAAAGLCRQSADALVSLAVEDTPQLGPSHIDPGELSLALDEVVRHSEELARFVSDLGLPGQTVRYEDLLRDPDTAIGSVQDGLGLRRAPLVGSTRKTTDDRLERIISNYDEVRGHLLGTEFERFLT